MNPEFAGRFRTVAQTALRIAAGLAYFSHGAQKLLGSEALVQRAGAPSS
ncbi:MAG: hypothetical protein HY701_04365 [Gemmatimonadetes bacterium]|nr:hypothetical protein [Gemmatimonadota bacterium]